ncbi:MAG: hypothetical protein D4R98_02345 [Comamonadaceae bacterium]|nr:MAG: hypothetical protein D4R98_02345 [Comamonadaceae bacterium]
MTAAWDALAPSLPSLANLPWAMHVGWGVVMAALLNSLLPQSVGVLRHLIILFVAVIACIPGIWGPVYWLGLAFQTPSVLAVLWAGQHLYSRWPIAAWTLKARQSQRSAVNMTFALFGVVLGWLLLLDTLALVPMQLYAWGFSPWSAGVALLLGLLPWIFQGMSGLRSAGGLIVLAVVVFTLLRLPTGNVWDALLDPWLWVVLHIYLVRMALRIR